METTQLIPPTERLILLCHGNVHGDSLFHAMERCMELHPSMSWKDPRSHIFPGYRDVNKGWSFCVTDVHPSVSWKDALPIPP